jgi:hypothetical protein
MATVDEMMEAYSLDAVDYAKKLNKALDFSESSIQQVEDICTLLYNEIPKGFFGKLIKKSPSEETIIHMSKMLGGYIGQVMIKHYGGNWTIEDFLNRGNTLVVNIGEMKTFPVSKVYKRFKNGSEDNVNYYYFVMTKELPKVI